MTEKGTTNEIVKITETAVSTFNTGVEITQRNVIQKVNRIIRELEVDVPGNIKITSKNIKLVSSLRSELSNLVVDKSYLTRLETYLKSFAKIKGVTDKLFEGVSNFIPDAQIFKDILEVNTTLTANSLSKSGINQNVVQPIADLVTKGVTSGANISDIEDALRTQILGDNQRLGGLERYTKQITRDALNQYSRNYNESISVGLGMEWYYYSGSIVDDTRTYCLERAGQYFHKKEVEQVPSRWNGMIQGTNSSSIFINAGGYNCRHIWMPVLIDAVPSNVIDRNVSKGNYQR